MAGIICEKKLFGALVLAAVCCCVPVIAATTQVQIVRYANDNVTVLNETTVNYTWMETHLPIYGDGVTHYYHQGPTFDDTNFTTLWDPNETVNILSRDMGTPIGTDVKDLCNLVGGMEAGEYVEIRASDNFNKKFDYDDVYEPEPELGKMTIAWNNPAFGGYVPAYTSGMRLIFMANTTNATGLYVFGNWDMHETLAEKRWHYFDDIYPSSSGLSVTDVDRIRIFSNDPAPPTANFTVNTSSGIAPLTVQFTDTSSNGPTSWAWTIEGTQGTDYLYTGGTSSSSQNPSVQFLLENTYDVSLTATNDVGSDDEVRADCITITTAPFNSIAVVTPNGGEIYLTNAPCSVNWTYTGDPGPMVLIELLDGLTEVGGGITTSIGSGGVGSIGGILPENMPLGPDFKIRITSTSNPTINDTSDASCIISVGSSITVETPNGGENYQRSSPCSVNWTYTGEPGPMVLIELLDGTTEVGGGITTSIGSGGVGSIGGILPDNMPLGTDFKIRITSTSNPTINDTSDASCTISEA